MRHERALPRYLRHHRAQGSTPKTLDWHRDSIGHFIAFQKGRGNSVALEDLAIDDVLDWIDCQRDRGLAQKTIQTRVVSLKAFTAWLADPDGGDMLDRDPLRKLKRPKVDDTPKETLAPADVEALLASCNRKTLMGCRDLAIMLLLFSTGVRDSELRGLLVDDVDWDKGLILVRRGKGGKCRVVPLGHTVAKALYQSAGETHIVDGVSSLTGMAAPRGER